MKKISILLLLFSFSVNAQDLFDFQHSKSFADYLAKSGQFDVAQKEYERLVFVKPNDDSLKLALLRSYRLGGKFKEGIARGRALYQVSAEIPAKQALEIGKMMVGANELDSAQRFWSMSKTIKPIDVNLLETTVLVLKNDFKTALANISKLDSNQSEIVEDYKNVLTMAMKDKYKSPALAGVLSAIVPGTGRFYSKDVKDGLVSLLFIGSTAFQAYRGFSKTGIKSPKGWGYGAVSFGFYLGGIYGAVKSAKGYNNRKKHGYREGIMQLFNMNF
jgi:TM2 domain-containing membrane protein YozV